METDRVPRGRCPSSIHDYFIEDKAIKEAQCKYCGKKMKIYVDTQRHHLNGSKFFSYYFWTLDHTNHWQL